MAGRPKRLSKSSLGLRIVYRATAVMVAVVFVIPMLVMVITSLKDVADIYVVPFRWIPHPFVWMNYVHALTQQPFGIYFLNSLKYTSLSLVGDLISCSIVGYAFVRYRSPFTDRLFYIVLALLLMPYVVLMVPQFILFSWMHWVGTYLPLIIPTFFAQSSFLIFLFRQFFRTLPTEVFEAAAVDGSGPLRTFLAIAVPMAIPAFSTATVFSFAFTWGNFLGPVVYLTQNNSYPVSVGLADFSAKFTIMPWNLLMAASVVSILPSVLVFFLLQKRIGGGFALGGIT
ncbi:MAG: carbohydrate ABC transporter permease [Firmicutes bacterium]|jgi:ABC-type glycerol-3-phosphate transport system permease component|nr:carbohydrate ABC transporter permease [Bacillota bacterium]